MLHNSLLLKMDVHKLTCSPAPYKILCWLYVNGQDEFLVCGALVNSLKQIVFTFHSTNIHNNNWNTTLKTTSNKVPNVEHLINMKTVKTKILKLKYLCRVFGQFCLYDEFNVQFSCTLYILHLKYEFETVIIPVNTFSK